ncbi:hydroxyacid dehydrogenase [Ramlibacter sp. USB13]|uniref:Hydroxyacid dehydrogenase n=1 Tax=Ramlibacter cellulosilyticus TaxID=2764187 RepID=A0A923SD98_9BURK|nr:NAD(P)-dependent oxidoreductase [Ramlibacter cellulosilyticus]MBC5781722.1 hydroxyacid dehydrogenase [Ramlibacter cellulosilyticus]
MEILLLERLVPEAQAWLEARHQVVYRPELAQDSAALRSQLYNVQSLVLPRKVTVTREFLDFAPVLRGLARMHVGTDNTDLEACRDRRVRVIQPINAHVRSNAEYLLASLLLLFRRGIGTALKGERNAPATLGRELHGSTVGLLGLAPSAHALAAMLDALGAKLVGYDPAVHHTSPMWGRLKVQPVGLQELVAQADAVTVQVLYASRYEHFINDKVLAHCRPGQVWTGTTRSSIFDPDALARALSDGRIEAAMLDGAEAGFAARGTPLGEQRNLYLTPRVGSWTRESRVRASWYVAQRLHETLTAPRHSGFEPILSAPMGLDSVSPPESMPAALRDD